MFYAYCKYVEYIHLTNSKTLGMVYTCVCRLFEEDALRQ
jgi:hypothetical protein